LPHSVGVIEPNDDVPNESRLTPAELVQLQRIIEAGLLARDARLSGAGFADATEQELRLLEDQGALARQRFIQANLGLVGMVSRQFATRCQLPDAELFQEGCLGLPACQLPTGSSPCASLNANSSIMLRSYSSIVSDTELMDDRLVGLLDDPSRRRESFGRPRVHPLVGLVYCASCGGRMTTAIAPRQGGGYGCRKDENPICPARVRIVAEPLEAYVEGYVIDQWRNPEAIKIAQSDDERMTRIREVTDEMRHLQEQKNEALRMKLRGEVDAKTFRQVTAEIDAAHDQLAREHNRLAREAAMPQLPDPSLAWEDLSAEDRRALTELLVDKIIVAPHPHMIDENGRRHYTIRAIPYQDSRQEAERLKSVHEARVKIVPRV
jgi:hypothetical protein